MLNAQEESDLHLVVWELDALYPDIPAQERLNAAKSTVLDLLKKNRIELQRYEPPGGELEKIAPSQWMSILDRSSNWEPTLPKRYLINLPGGKWPECR